MWFSTPGPVVVGWSLDRRPTAAMVNAALGMAVEARVPDLGRGVAGRPAEAEVP